MTDKLLDYKNALERFDPTLGFEIHIELNTKSKIFSSAQNEFASPPNTNITELCLGLPGTLPVLNKQALNSAILLGKALNCKIANISRFSRKHYFYPDLPKAYQISQYDKPIVFDGYVDIVFEGETYKIEIERAHLEEDAGKLSHASKSGRIHGATHSLVDYNRAGVPLIEIVTKPIVGLGDKAPEIAKAFVDEIRQIAIALNISSARMDKGQMRCDANVSLSEKNSEKLGTRTETKNINSLKSVEDAIKYEIRRQAYLLSCGQSVLQETRHFQEKTKSTLSGRPKSDSDDYRYLDDPDLVDIVLDQSYIDNICKNMPELPGAKKARLKSAWNLGDKEFQDIINADLLDIIENAINEGLSPKAAKKWYLTDILRISTEKNIPAGDLKITPQHIIEIQSNIDSNKITDAIARQIIAEISENGKGVSEIIASKGLEVVSDDNILIEAIDEALKNNPDILDKIKAGKTQAAGALIGPIMQKFKGKADAKRLMQLILEKAKSL